MAVSAYLLTEITKSRNPIEQAAVEGRVNAPVSAWKLVAAEVGYIALVYLSTLETIANLVLYGALALLGSDREVRMFSKMAKLCLTTIGCCTASILLNPFKDKMPKTIPEWNREVDVFAAELYSHF